MNEAWITMAVLVIGAIVVRRSIAPRRPTLDALIRALEDPKERWQQGRCTIENADRGVEVWTENIPVINTNVHRPASMVLSLSERWRLYRAVCKARENALARNLNQKQESTNG